MMITIPEKIYDVEVFDKPHSLVRGTLRASKSSNKTQELFDLAKIISGEEDIIQYAKRNREILARVYRNKYIGIIRNRRNYIIIGSNRSASRLERDVQRKFPSDTCRLTLINFGEVK